MALAGLKQTRKRTPAGSPRHRSPSGPPKSTASESRWRISQYLILSRAPRVFAGSAESERKEHSIRAHRAVVASKCKTRPTAPASRRGLDERLPGHSQPRRWTLQATVKRIEKTQR